MWFSEVLQCADSCTQNVDSDNRPRDKEKRICCNKHRPVGRLLAVPYCLFRFHFRRGKTRGKTLDISGSSVFLKCGVSLVYDSVNLHRIQRVQFKTWGLKTWGGSCLEVFACS